MEKENFVTWLDKGITLYKNFEISNNKYCKSVISKNNSLCNKFKELISDETGCDWKKDLRLIVNYNGVDDLTTLTIKDINFITYNCINIYIKGTQEFRYDIQYIKNSPFENEVDFSKLLLNILINEEDLIKKINIIIDESNLRTLYNKQLRCGKELHDFVNCFVDNLIFPLSEKEITIINDTLKEYDLNINGCDNTFRLSSKLLSNLKIIYENEGFEK